MGRSFVACGAVMLCACSVERLPPPQAPTRDVPETVVVPIAAPPPGTGRVLLEANGEAAHVVEVSATDDPAVVGVRPVCTTPCVVDLPYGPHPLVFRSKQDPDRESETEVEIGPRPKIVRHALGERHDGGAAYTLGVVMLVLGSVAATTGGILWSAGAAGRSDALTPSAQSLTVAGGTTALLGLPLLLASRPTERPGATTEWALPR